ncbi:MAG: long-chain fatty acid--CoA ligase [Rhizobiaceae bacterium]
MPYADYADQWPEDAFRSTPQRLVETAGKFENRIAYRTLQDGVWSGVDWKTYLQQIREAASALIALGVKVGDTVCILGFNRPEWTIMAHAAMMVGAAPAGIYFTSSPEEIEYILNHSEAPVLLAETDEHFARIARVRDKLRFIRRVVMMRGATISDPLQLSWEDFNAVGDKASGEQVDARLQAIGPETTAMRIYTSGTTGPPKAVVLSHAAIGWTCWTLRNMFNSDEGGRVISYLPLAHIAEATNSIHNHAGTGYELAFAASIETLGDHLKDIRPTLFFGVPRVWQKIHMALTSRLSQATGTKARLANWAIGVGGVHANAKLNGDKPGTGLRIRHAIAERLVLSKIRQAIGLDQCVLPVSGAAPISRQVLDFFASLGIVIYEVYGQSEDCGPTTFNVPEAVKLGTVGRPIPGLELRIAGDGEILVRAPSLFDGYAKDSKATASTLEDGWMHTGDLGRIDNEGYVTIVGRKKDILITSGGKNITPANIEQALCDLPLVEHAVVCGEGRHFLTALLTLNQDELSAYAKAKNIDMSKVRQSSELNNMLSEAIEKMNAKFARVEHIRKFAVAPEIFSLEGGELTPTLKVKRAFVTQKYAGLIDGLYAMDAQ